MEVEPSLSRLELEGLTTVTDLAGSGIGEAKSASHQVFGEVEAQLLNFCFIFWADQDVDVATVVLAITFLRGIGEGKLIDKIETSTGDDLEAQVAFGGIPAFLHPFNFVGCSG